MPRQVSESSLEASSAQEKTFQWLCYLLFKKERNQQIEQPIDIL